MRLVVYLFLAVVILIFIGGRTAVSYWVDLQWFRSLGYASVFWKTFGLEWGTFAAFAVLTFLILFSAFLALRHSHAADLPETHTIFFAGRPIELPVAKVLRIVAVIGAVIIAIVTGFAMQSQWPTLALYWYAPQPPPVSPTPSSAARLASISSLCPHGSSSPDGCLRSPCWCAFLPCCFSSLPAAGARLAGASAAASLPWRGVSIAAGFLLLHARHP